MRNGSTKEHTYTSMVHRYDLQYKCTVKGTVSSHLMERGGCMGRCDYHQCTVQWRTCYSHQVSVSLASQ